MATSDRARRKPGNERRMSAKRWITRSVSPPWKPEMAPERHADRDAEPDRQEADQEREPAAVEEPGQDVAPEMIGAERVRPRDGPERLRQALALRVVRGEERGGEGEDQEATEQDQPRHRGAVAAEALPALPEAAGARDGPARRAPRPARAQA